MRKILIVGIGAGNPDHMTVEAIEALNRADVLFIPDKGAEKAALAELRAADLARFIRSQSYRTVTVPVPQRAAAGSDYRGSVDDWHAKLAEIYGRHFAEEIGEGECGALLVWGDPSLYDSTLRIIERIGASGLALDYEVIPGITSVQALAARHRIALNRIGEPVLITTGRKLASTPAEDSIVMLDGEQAFTRLAGAGLRDLLGCLPRHSGGDPRRRQARRGRRRDRAGQARSARTERLDHGHVSAAPARARLILR